MAFEVYVPRATNENRVSITKHHISLGRKLAGQLKGSKVEAAYDKDTNQLRIRSVDDGGMVISKNKIGAKGIFKFFDIDVKGSFPAEYNQKDDAIYVKLGEKK